MLIYFIHEFCFYMFKQYEINNGQARYNINLNGENKYSHLISVLHHNKSLKLFN
jgi:hypothetical protein